MMPGRAAALHEVLDAGTLLARGPEATGPGTAPGQRLCLSQYTWVERAAEPVDGPPRPSLLVRSVRTAGVVELCSPRAAGLLFALSTPTTVAAASHSAGLPEEATRAIVAMLVGTGAVELVPDEVDAILVLRSLAQWALAAALPPDRVTVELARAVERIPAEMSQRDAALLWEIHHDGSRRVDISQARIAAATEHHGPTDYVEYDVSDADLRIMGTFRGLRPPPEGVDLASWVAAAAEAPALQHHGGVGHLLDTMGVPDLIGRVARGAGETRLLWYLRSPEVFDAARQTLRAAGVDERRLDWSGLRELIGGQRPMRLAVGVLANHDDGEAGITSIGIEVFYPPALLALPDALMSMNVPPAVIAEVRALLTLPELRRLVALSPHGITDLQTRRVLHAKVTFTITGPVVKTYLETRSRPVSDRALMTGEGAIPATWSPDDLRFHVRSRFGRRDGPYLIKRDPPRVPLNEHLEDPTVIAVGDLALPAPIVDAPTVTLEQLLTTRRSDRDWTGPPIPLATLATLLFRAMHPSGDQHRYPSAGNVYENDVVVLADRVDGLPRGCYLYRPLAHALRPLHGDEQSFIALITGSSRSTGQGEAPQALCIVAARFDDLAAKYERNAYGLMLKDASMLMATIGLVATELGVGCVLLGGGDSDAFARATGLDYYVQGSIAELALSTLVHSAADATGH